MGILAALHAAKIPIENNSPLPASGEGAGVGLFRQDFKKALSTSQRFA